MGVVVVAGVHGCCWRWPGAALHGWIVPRIGEFRPTLEIAGQQGAGGTGAHRRHHARNPTGMIPSFELRDVALLDGAGPGGAAAAARGGRAVAALAVAAWASSSCTSTGPSWTSAAPRTGKSMVGGLDFASTAGDDTARARLVLLADRIRDSRRHACAGPTSSAARRRWRSSRSTSCCATAARSHAMRLDATPPPAWGDRFQPARRCCASRSWPATAGNWQQWEGQVYADFARVDRRAVAAAMPTCRTSAWSAAMAPCGPGPT